jgi:hypothetical protein
VSESIPKSGLCKLVLTEIWSALVTVGREELVEERRSAKEEKREGTKEEVGISLDPIVSSRSLYDGVVVVGCDLLRPIRHIACCGTPPARYDQTCHPKHYLHSSSSLQRASH